MASIMDFQKRVNLESERDAVLRAIRAEEVKVQIEGKGASELEALRRVLGKIQDGLASCEPVFAEVPESPPVPVLPDSHYHEPVPSQRVRFQSSWNEGAPRPKKGKTMED